MLVSTAELSPYAARLRGGTNAITSASQEVNRSAAALRILRIGASMEAKEARPSWTSAAIPEKLSGVFQQELGKARSSFPGISNANAGHIATYETIVANRSQYPPGEFYIHTELGGGASITTRIPAITPTLPTVSVSVTALNIGFHASGGGLSVSVAAMQESYAEWS